MNSFTLAYFEAALWSTSDESDDQGGEPLDKNYSIGDFADETRDKMIADCVDFQERFGALIDAGGGDYERAGHDFWLTRNSHGAGFWDGDWPEPQATQLTDASKEYGEFYLYVGDDGEIYGPPPGAHGVRENRGLVGPGTDGLYKYHGASIELSGPVGGWWNATVRLRGHNEKDFDGISREEALKKAMKWIDAGEGLEEGHHVADFNTLDDLIAHARDELGAVSASGEGAQTKLYFPRGGQYKYEEATVWRKEGYWHAQAPGSRNGVLKLPSDARSIGAQLGRRAAAPRSVRDYEAIDRRDRVIAGPFKSYGDAKDAAGPAGAVRFVPSRGKHSKATETRETRSAHTPSPTRRRARRS